jgi:hypothetical protein
MTWLLNYHRPLEPTLLDGFFLSLGKGLCLATSFEKNCQYVLRIMRIVEHYERSQDAVVSLIEYVRSLKDPLLGQALRELSGRTDTFPHEIGLLEKARIARNYVVHEAGVLGYFSDTSEEDLKEKAANLRAAVLDLAAGDNIVSGWSYEIQEKAPAPRYIQRVYPKCIESWVCDNGAAVLPHPTLSDLLESQ